jgi:hypothetical protein
MGYPRCVALVLATAALAVGPSLASAQSAPTGTLTGRVIFCRALPRPAAMADSSDATPGYNRRLPSPLEMPVPDMQLSVQGTGVAAATDDTGAFMLTGVPTSQPLTLLAQPVSGPLLVLNAPSPSLADGQTVDLGTLTLGDCPAAPASFTPQPDADARS